jgi:phage protein D
MTPAYVITADGQDVTAAIAQRLVSLTVVDEKGVVSDSAELVIADPLGELAAPRRGAVLNIALGYGSALSSLGSYTVETVTISGPPDRITVSAKATDFLGALKVRKHRGWRDVTIAGLVAAIAAEHDLIPAVDPAFAETVYAQIDQTESDLNLLTRLARDHGAIAKPVDGHLVFTAKGEAVTVSGAALPVLNLSETDLLSWSTTAAERTQYAGVKASWYDAFNAEMRKTGAGGNDGPILLLPGVYEDEDRARAAVAAKWKAVNQVRGTLDITLTGRVDAQAESPLSLVHRRAEVAGDWIVTRAEHRIDSGGFTTALTADRPQG